MRTLYATDASEYQEMPLAVALPKDETDLGELVRFARDHRVGLIPRAAGTSLAGQVVGSGMVVDVGRHLNAILGFDLSTRRVRVQPGVVRNELNTFLKPYGLFFPPETATASRAMIGGMVGNNSCGANSITYGTTREHLVSARGFLSDGSTVSFGPLSKAEFLSKCEAPDSLETKIYRLVRDLLGDAGNRHHIREHFPKPSISRRNTGYALDQLMDCAAFDEDSSRPFNMCRLLAGSEGTLFLGCEFELNCEPLPPPGALMCAHFATVQDALRATVIAMRHRPTGCELVDRNILECTKANLEQVKNRFFLVGDPGALLVVEISHTERSVIEAEMNALETEFRAAGIGYAFPVLWGAEGQKVWDLRRAGQGLMNNVVGDARPREVVEDTAVDVEDLPAYIAEFEALLSSKYQVACVYYAHAGAGELHLRPLFDLKSLEGLRTFRALATDVAALVKKYRGSLSGEHGDGRLRGEFIRFMVGDECYAMLRRVKETFDPAGVFNPQKIIDTPPMDTSLRQTPGRPEHSYETIFDFSASEGVLRAVERCTGVGECRKLSFAGGTMCPSYMATRNEQDSTRARANMLRDVLTNPRDGRNPWNSDEVASVMDLCLSCKGCRAECPSNVDIARLKAEWQQHYNDARGVPLRSRMIAGYARSMRWAALAPAFYNWAVTEPAIAIRVKRFAGFAEERSIPKLHSTTLTSWHRRHANPATLDYPHGRVHLFCDEFTNFNDTPVGIKAVQLLNRLGYFVVIPKHVESGRALLSKGMIRDARRIAIRNVQLLSDIVTGLEPLVGIEPSAILGFRDEYIDLVPNPLRERARMLAGNCLLIDEFIDREAEAGRITSRAFSSVPQKIKLHGHCHQKALSSLVPTVRLLELPENYKVQIIPSGCCGMAGSFGFEKEHFSLSQKIGELVLFPNVRATNAETLVAASGTSCRHQIRDATGRIAQHPVEILHDSLL
jgi:FAD/FMN-containing dehydrogenase/Fe-S oxidoreductase